MCTSRTLSRIRSRSRPGRARQRGISFMELVIFIVIIGIALAGIIGTMNLTTRASAEPLVAKQALMLAEGFMEEVQLARFTFCDGADDKVQEAEKPADCTRQEGAGPEAGETRPFDNVNDYVDSYGAPKEAFKNGAGLLTDAGGQVISLTGYKVTLTITEPSLNTPGGAIAAGDALLIRVSVFYNDTHMVSLDGYRLRYAPNSPP